VTDVSQWSYLSLQRFWLLNRQESTSITLPLHLQSNREKNGVLEYEIGSHVVNLGQDPGGDEVLQDEGAAHQASQHPGAGTGKMME